ncbi:MAG: hypothetical protein ABFD53_05965 [Anaerolineaceae bacterium]
MMPECKPGLIVLFGSGETSASGRKIFDRMMRRLPPSPKVALLETPAGFELNSAQVIGRVGDFLRSRLQNYDPQIQIVPARKRGTPFSPDDPQIANPLLSADMIFMGPGSPSYAVRQLQNSVAWHYLLARHRLGATLALASAATVAVSAYSLPVYEIYKVGEELHWKTGLDLFAQYGLSLIFIPHWNNNDGGNELDTNRCFMGRPRFLELIKQLPSGLTIIGLDEKTALIIDPQSGGCEVVGIGGITLIHTGSAHDDAFMESELHETGLTEVAQLRNGHVHRFVNGQTFSLSRIGPFHPPIGGDGLPEDDWEKALRTYRAAHSPESIAREEIIPPKEIVELIDKRQIARSKKDWELADSLRKQIFSQGWSIIDTPDGVKIEPVSE